tara:strand:- start:815 stop:1030 length:216 start_codon:yes stop_codon:yes gene_type:complete
MTMQAQDLLRKLDLSVGTNGPSGRYLTAREGPAEGDAYFAAPLDEKIRFGIQDVPFPNRASLGEPLHLPDY